MPRTTPDASLTTRTARSKLKHRPKPYFRLVRGGASPIHLGYYRQAEGRPGTWIARRYLGAQRYEVSSLGTADDDPSHPADGVTVLDLDAAGSAAVAWADKRLTEERATRAEDSALTVRKAVRAYITVRKARDSKTGADMEARMSSQPPLPIPRSRACGRRI